MQDILQAVDTKAKRSVNPLEKKPNAEFDYRIDHRKRLRNRYEINGADTFTECEMLEMLLFYAIPRKDTKPLAHQLLRHFGSIKNVIGASEEQLAEAGATKSVSFYLRFINDVENLLSRLKDERDVFDDYDSIGRYACAALKNCETETLFMIMLDKRNRLIGEAYLGTGDFQNVRVDYRKLTELCLTRKAAKVAVAHNHPSGILDSTLEDVMATRQLENLLDSIGVELYEHFVVNGKNYVGINKMRQDAVDGIDEF